MTQHETTPQPQFQQEFEAPIPTLQERVAGIAAHLRGDVRANFVAAMGMYEDSRAAAGDTTVQTAEREIRINPTSADMHARQVRTGLRSKIDELDRELWKVGDAAVADVVAKYDLQSPSHVHVSPADARKREAVAYLRQQKGGHRYAYKQQVEKLANDSAETDIAALKTPKTLTETDKQVVTAIGTDDFDRSLDAKITKLETVLASAVPKAAGRAVLGRLSRKNRDEQEYAMSQTEQAVQGVAGFMRMARQQYATPNPQTTQQIKQYLRAANLVPGDSQEIIDRAVARCGRLFDADVAKTDFTRFLEQNVIPTLRANGYFPPAAAGTPRAEHATSQNPLTARIDQRIATMRDEGYEDAKIKTSLLREYHPNGSSGGNEDAFKYVSGLFMKKQEYTGHDGRS